MRKQFLETLWSKLASLSPLDIGPWRDRCRQWVERYPVVLPEYRCLRDFISTYVFADVLSDELADGELIIPGSSGAGVERFNLAFRVKPDQRIFLHRGLGRDGIRNSGGHRRMPGERTASAPSRSTATAGSR